MAYSDIYIGSKKQTKRWLLTFTFILSFFAISGYVSNSLLNAKVPNTEAFSVSSYVFKNSIGYKRASLFFYKTKPGHYKIGKNFDKAVLHYNRLVSTQNQNLKQLFLFTKLSLAYQAKTLYYATDKYQDTPLFQIS
jgi:hypothetical protein